MKIKPLLFSLFACGTIALTLLAIPSCNKEEEGGCGETNISQNGSNRSHNMGQNCMNCHKSGGPGEGCFNAAGTVYDSLQTSTRANGTIRLYTGPNGTGSLAATIQIDGRGNFHTTDNINFGSGLYPAVVGSSGEIRYMGSTINQGACNSCHGVSNDRIWVN